MNHETQRASILQMAQGAFQERVDYEMRRCVDNILDVNTKATAKRKITLTIELTPDDDRRQIRVNVVAKATLAATNPVATSLCVTTDGNGEMVAAEMVPQLPGQMRTGWRDRETALIELRSLFIPNEGTEYLLDLLSRMSDENTVSTNDNGVTQTVTARQGVALNAVVNVRPRIKLQPFRTFLEVAQPESEFLLRVDSEKGIAFFEADGGIWRLEAKRNIAEYFERGLKDLIEQGKVVIMQ